ncbi:MAG: DUF456 family protein [Phycisphaerae bacterium]
MIMIWAILLLVVNLFWVGLLVLGLPGTWLILLTCAVAEWFVTGEGALFTKQTLLLLAALAVIGELIEFGAGVVGAKKFGGSRKGAIGALVGSIVGGLAFTFFIPIPIIGTLIGACLGAAAGSIFMELRGGRTMDEAMRSGVGAGIGRFSGTVAKIAVGAVMWLIAAVAAFIP